MTERTERLDRILERNLAWIAAADSKTAPILAVDTAMLGVLAALTPAPPDWRVVSAVFAVVTCLFLLASLVFLIAAVFPRVDGPEGSLVFFGGIRSRDPDAYVSEILAAPEEELARDYGLQIHRNAQIAGAKYWGVRAAMISLFCAVLPWVIAIGLLYGS